MQLPNIGDPPRRDRADRFDAGGARRVHQSRDRALGAEGSEAITLRCERSKPQGSTTPAPSVRPSFEYIGRITDDVTRHLGTSKRRIALR
jgi:hypothetical protein